MRRPRCPRRRSGRRALGRGSRGRDPAAEKIEGIEVESRFPGHKGASADVRNELSVAVGEPAGEEAAGHALLSPELSGRELSAAPEHGHLGRGSRTAWRAVVSHAGTEDEVAAVGVRTRWGTKNLDVVDFRSGGAGHALCFQLVADLSGLSEQVSGVAEFEQLSRQLGDEKPVA